MERGESAGLCVHDHLSEAKAHQRRARREERCDDRKAPDGAKRNRLVPRGTAAEQRGGKHISTIKAGQMTGFYGGDGRTRTAVQTTHKRAFYTLILPLVFDDGLPEGGPPEAYPLCLNGDSETLPRASGLNDTPGPGHNRHKVRRDTRLTRSLGGSD